MDVQQRLDRHLAQKPDVNSAAFVAPNATVVGDVTLGALSSVWYGCVLRGDINSIAVGEGTNIQDLAMVHLADDHGVKIGRYSTIGHSAIIHACEIGDRCIVGANSLVTQGFVAPPGSMIFGSPAKVVRLLTEKEKSGIRHWADKYIAVAKAHAALE